MEKKFEDCMEELSSVVSQMQKEEIPLEEMLVQRGQKRQWLVLLY